MATWDRQCDTRFHQGNCGSAAASPLAAHAQQDAKVPRLRQALLVSMSPRPGKPDGLGHVLQLSQNIKIAGGNDATRIELPYLIQQSLFRIGERQGAASVGAMIEHQQIGFDALGERGEFPGRGMMGSTITLSFSGDLLIGRLRIRLVNQYIAAGAMLDKAWRRRRIA